MAHVLDIRDIHVFDGLLRRLEAVLDGLICRSPRKSAACRRPPSATS